MTPLGEHSVPASAGGIAFQFQRALLHLASAADGYIGVETDDDVAGRSEAELRRWEQDKLSFQNTGQPFSDRSKNLWNTLLIWLQKFDDPNITPEQVQLHLVTNRPVPACLARQIGEADTREAAVDCVAAMAGISSTQDEIQQLIDRVLTFGDEALIKMILRVRLFDAGFETNPATIGEATVQQLQCPSWVDGQAVAQALMGWVHDVVMQCWSRNEAAWISCQAFNDRKHALILQIGEQRYREHPASAVLVTPAEREAAELRQFVHHLALIRADDAEVVEAVDDFLRFDTEYSRLLMAGSVQQRDFDDFFDELKRRWRHILRLHSRSLEKRSAEEVGRDVFTDTCDPDFRGQLGGVRTSQTYFTCGGYHTLADADGVWWHPEFDGQHARDRGAS